MRNGHELKKYQVVFEVVETYVVEVSADDESEAYAIAIDRLEHDPLDRWLHASGHFEHAETIQV